MYVCMYPFMGWYQRPGDTSTMAYGNIVKEDQDFTVE